MWSNCLCCLLCFFELSAFNPLMKQITLTVQLNSNVRSWVYVNIKPMLIGLGFFSLQAIFKDLNYPGSRMMISLFVYLCFSNCKCASDRCSNMVYPREASF